MIFLQFDAKYMESKKLKLYGNAQCQSIIRVRRHCLADSNELQSSLLTGRESGKVDINPHNPKHKRNIKYIFVTV